jgi:demethylmenaquinone methyltransferase / 2-methoxy-6-polyprenyl-1,4-benzoquinol methylase
VAAAQLAFQIAEPMDRDAAPAVTHAAAAAAPSPRKLAALELFSGLPRRYDALSAAFSFGQDPRWRRELVRSLAPAPGARVLDVATGTGLVAAELLARYDVSIVALDQSAQMLAAARRRFAARAVRVEVVQAQAEALPFPAASFDAVTFTYLLRYVDDPAATMRELARVLRPGGRIASLEFGIPPWLPARAAWRLYTALGLPLLGRAVSREWYEVGRFLGPSIREFYARYPLTAIVGMWRAAGLADVVVRRMSLGGGVVIAATRERAAGDDGAARAAGDGGAEHAGTTEAREAGGDERDARAV